MTERYCLFLVVLTIASRVYAQSSNVTQCIPEYHWSINSLSQTPCLVASYLRSLCLGHTFSVDALPQGNHYVGPSSADADPCSCNSVTYLMISACAGCQSRLFLNFSAWIMYCPSVDVVPIGAFPVTIPDTYQVPSWAFLNISLTNGTFSPAEAVKGFEAATRSVISATSISPAAVSSSTASPPPQPTSDSEGSSGLSSGAIAGTTVGALIAVIVILLALFWLRLLSKKQGNHKVAYHPLKAGPSYLHAHSKSLSGSPSVITPYTYNASEGARWQPHSEMSTVYAIPPRMRFADNVVRPSAASQVVVATPRASTLTTPRGYRGIPEV